MRSIYTLFLGVCFCVLFVTSCKEAIYDPKSNADAKQGYREEKLLGVRVRIPNSVPTELFSQSTKEFILYVNRTYFSNQQARLAELPVLTYKEASEIMEKYRSKYPNVDAETLNDKDLARIHQDFPDVLTANWGGPVWADTLLMRV